MLLCTLLFVACGGDDDDGADRSGAGAGGIATATQAAETAGEKPTAAPTPAPGEVAVANEPFSVETADGTVLRGHIYSPDGPKRQALIIAAPGEQSLWAQSTAAFTSEGIAIFTFDPRGFGETGGEQNIGALADDIQLVTLFAKSREYPLLYVMAIGPEASEAALEKVARREELSGLVTYGFEGTGETPHHLSLAPVGAWDGEDVLGDPALAEQVLAFVLGGN
jgi:hypothetical protein